MMNAAETRADRPITGRRIAAIFVGGFAIIIAVNLTLAVNAVRTFPGLETDSSYVASQQFQADRAAQDALNWDVAGTFEGGSLRLSIRDAGGQSVRPEITSAVLGRATTVADDRAPDFTWDGADLVAPAELAPGNWNLRVELTAPDGTAFRRRIPLRVTP